MCRIGTAGWTVLGKDTREETHLHRYSRLLSCVEVNSSFYRPHRIATWKRWADETPDNFRFSIKAPRTITHEKGLRDAGTLLEPFFEQVQALGAKAGPVLFQLPPSLQFKGSVVEDFFSILREFYFAEIALEPRHSTWFTNPAHLLFDRFAVSRVAADPPKGDLAAAVPGGNSQLTYYRLHGSPRTYYSAYDGAFLTALAKRISSTRNAWIIFDNTALSYAFANALELKSLISGD